MTHIFLSEQVLAATINAGPTGLLPDGLFRALSKPLKPLAALLHRANGRH